jgi:chromosome segregation ATPase
VLLDKEAMGRRVEAVVKGAGHDAPRESLSLSGAIIDTHDCAKAYELERIKSESAALSERIQLIDQRAKALRSEMEEHKKTIAAQRASLSQRRSDAESATYGLEAREARELDGVQAGIRRTKRRWEMKHDDIVTGRISLCREAARLAGLKRHRKTREDGNIREYFWIGNKLPIFDLRELHST